MEPDNDNTQSFVVLTKGTMVGHYRIVEKIGAGGMGEVYLAEDTQLNRKVALKFLPSHLCQDEDCRSRFKREAQATAKLNHPNIVTIYEVGDHGGRPYFVMEHVAGKPLREFSRVGELGIERVIELVIQICDGLETAHSEKITHRDIKPSNIIIDSHGRAKILDFGLAAVQGQEHLTQTGSTLGTVRYMSPEQVEGKNIDHRSDLFSLGIVLYELLTGKTPFNRDNDVAIGQAIISASPEPMAKYRANIPEELQRIVSKLLEKDTSLRYQHADGVISDLKGLIYDSSQSGYSRIMTAKPKKTKLIAGIAAFAVIVVAAVLYTVFRPMSDRPPSGDAVPMIAVLPFDNLGLPEDDYFADGMTDEITSRLAGIKGLGVISRTSSMKYRTTDKSLKEIGTELGVAYILEGTVRWSKTGNQSKVRITPQLIRVADDRHLWADNYEQALIEMFAVQADIAEKIVEQLGLTLLESDRQNLAKIPTENPEAYQYYLKALQKIRRGSENLGSITAQATLDSAVALDTSFALAHALRSEAYSDWAYNSPESEYGKIALESAKRSLELQPGLPQGHFALGNYYYYVDIDYNRALEHFSMAKSELYSDPELLHAISSVQMGQGKFEEALENRSKAVELDPLNARRHAALASVLRSLRRFNEAEQTINRAIALEPEIQNYYEDKIECLISHYADIEKVKPVISEALKHCDTTEFVIKNSSVTRYIPDLQTDSIIAIYIRKQTAEYIQKKTADTSKHLHPFFHDRPRFTYQHLDILEDYNDETRKFAETYKDEDGFIMMRGLLLSFIGECDRAIEYGLREKELLSIGERYLQKTWIIIIVARIYANCGKYDKAIDELELVLAQETSITVNTLKYKHWIDPLRDNPRYQALMKKYAFTPNQ